MRQLGPAALAYADAGGATQPATRPAATRPAAEAERLWALLHDGGQVILMRHATTTPGSGDPPGFKLGDCSTQRNLSDAGRAQARRVGDEVRRRGVPVGRVLSSQYCRCLDTAKLAFGKAEEEPALNLAFADEDKRKGQVEAVRRVIADWAKGHKDGKEDMVLVTHSVNVDAIAGVAADMGEMVVLTPDGGGGGFRVAGRLKVP